MQYKLLGEKCWKNSGGISIPFIKRARVCKTEERDVMPGREDAAYL
jgi:hypothetical protein